jgi:hypothetical protein
VRHGVAVVQGINEDGLWRLRRFPGVGKVRKITDDELVVRQEVSVEEKQRMAAQGMLAVDAREVRYRNVLRAVVIPQ